MTHRHTDRSESLTLSFLDRVDAADRLWEAAKRMTPEQMASFRRGMMELKAMRLRFEAEMRAEGRPGYWDEDGC